MDGYPWGPSPPFSQKAEGRPKWVKGGKNNLSNDEIVFRRISTKKKHQHEFSSLIVWVSDADMADMMIRIGSSKTRKPLIMTSRPRNSDESKNQTVCQMTLEGLHTIYLAKPAAMSLAKRRS